MNVPRSVIIGKVPHEDRLLLDLAGGGVQKARRTKTGAA